MTLLLGNSEVYIQLHILSLYHICTVAWQGIPVALHAKKRRRQMSTQKNHFEHKHLSHLFAYYYDYGNGKNTLEFQKKDIGYTSVIKVSVRPIMSKENSVSISVVQWLSNAVSSLWTLQLAIVSVLGDFAAQISQNFTYLISWDLTLKYKCPFSSWISLHILKLFKFDRSRNYDSIYMFKSTHF